MSTLAEEFLADLEEDEEEVNQEDNNEKENDKMVEDIENGEEDEISEELLGTRKKKEDSELQTLKYSSVRELLTIYDGNDLKRILQQIEKAMSAPMAKHIGAVTQHPEYDLIVEANTMTMSIMDEIKTIYKFIRDRYSKKFPDLESSVVNILDYIRVVQRIGNELDLSKVDLSDILPAATVMVVTVTASTVFGSVSLSQDELDRIQEACSIALSLDESRKKIIEYVENRMSSIAPNLTVLVGSSTAAKLMSVAGGLNSLSKLPSCNVQLLGTEKKALSGFSSTTARPQAYIHEAEIVRDAPQHLRIKAVRVLSGKISLAARVDCYNEDPTGNVGQKFRDDIEKKLEKLQEPPPPKLPKPLSVPDDGPKKRRGGKRMRKIREKYQMTELRKQQNRIPFGLQSQESVRNTSKNLGMLGLQGGGKVRLSGMDKGILKKAKVKHVGSSGATSGLSSSLAFTPAQGLELSVPAAMQKVKEANEKYFGSDSFFSVQQKKEKK